MNEMSVFQKRKVLFLFLQILKPDLILNLILSSFKEGQSSRFESFLRIHSIF